MNHSDERKKIKVALALGAIMQVFMTFHVSLSKSVYTIMLSSEIYT